MQLFFQADGNARERRDPPLQRERDVDLYELKNLYNIKGEFM